MDLVLASTEPDREDCPDRKYQILDVRTISQSQGFIADIAKELRKRVSYVDQNETVDVVKDGSNATFKVTPDIHVKVSPIWGDVVTTRHREFHKLT